MSHAYYSVTRGSRLSIFSVNLIAKVFRFHHRRFQLLNVASHSDFFLKVSHLPRFSTTVNFAREVTSALPRKFKGVSDQICDLAPSQWRARPLAETPAIQIADSIQRGTEYTFEKRRFCARFLSLCTNTHASLCVRVCVCAPVLLPFYHPSTPFNFPSRPIRLLRTFYHLLRQSCAQCPVGS